MELRVNDYVRTDTGDIGKITKIIGEENDIKDCYLNFKDMVVYGKEEDVIGIQGKVIKSSPNIIDLIEVGDYVNGYQVISIGIDDNKKNVELYVATQGYDELVLEQDIKSIVTKEQFESMEYKVGE